MWALVDCNSFFCSVEKVFHPGLEGKPVVVLSSNDGCIVALTPEAKAVGLHRGDPIFRCRDTVNRFGVTVFSTNMMLYAAMSRRVTSILRQCVQHVENYSIDESFCDLEGYEALHDLNVMMHEVGERIRLWTDIPVSIGIAPSKTLAKMGSKFAKQYKGYNGVCSIVTDEQRRKALSLFPLDDVWGIGRNTLQKLNYWGIATPLELADKSESWVKSHLHKPGYQTWLELNGHPCIDTTEVVRNQNICTSRSFGNMVGDLAELKSAVSHFASSCANKLRGQDSGAQEVTVFVCSNRFREDLPQYCNAATVPLVTPTADTLEISKAAQQALERIYRRGILYKKAGVAVGRLQPMEAVQGDLFDPIANRAERAALMQTIDRMNQRFGMKTIQLGTEGFGHEPWNVKCERRSPNFLTDINEILTIKDPPLAAHEGGDK